MTKNSPPKRSQIVHAQFLRFAQKRFDGKKGFELTLNNAGKTSGSQCTSCGRIYLLSIRCSTFPNTNSPRATGPPFGSLKSPHKIRRIQEAAPRWNLDALHNGTPSYTCNSPHMFPSKKKIKKKNPKQVWQRLQIMGCSSPANQADSGVICPIVQGKRVPLKDAFYSDSVQIHLGLYVFNEDFVKRICNAFFDTKGNGSPGHSATSEGNSRRPSRKAVARPLRARHRAASIQQRSSRSPHR